MRSLVGACLLHTAGAAVAVDDAAALDSCTAHGCTPVLLAQASFDDLFESDGLEDAGVEADEASSDSTEAETGSVDSVESSGSVDDLFGDAPEDFAADAVAASSGVSFSGFVQNELAYGYTGPDPHFQHFLTRAKLYLKGRLNSRVSWQVGGHVQYNPVYDFETFYPDRVDRDQKVDGWIDETFLDIGAGKWEFRLGRQHIVWGEMVGLFFADVISALDLRQFVLPDFEIIRIPQWAIRAEYYEGDFHGEFVFIPYMTIDDVGEFGAEFFPFPVTAPAGVSVRFLDDKTPNDPGEDFGFGARGSYYVNGWDMSLFYYTSPDKTAAYEREIRLGPSPQLLFRPIHERIHQVGSTVSKGYGSFVLKAEAIQTMDRLMTVTRLNSPDGLVETDELRYVIGADWAGFGGYNANFQFFQTWFQDHDRDMLFKEVETGMSILIRTTSWHPDITPEVLWIRSLNRDEWLLQPKISWEFARNWRAVLGADIFEGNPTNLFGRFDNSDRVYYELRYSF
ncbi:MAG: DUF1302 family protein [Gammaproteobacteria bacterium]